MDTKLNIDYCDKQCPIGREARTKFLDEENSVCAAVSKFWAFTEKCFNTCPYKDKHTNVD